MPGRVAELHGRLPGAQILRRDGGGGAVVEGGLRVRPLSSAVPPLETVVVEMARKRDARWERAVAQQIDGAGARDLVDVGYEEDVALGWRLIWFGERGEGLREECVAGEAFALPGVAGGEGGVGEVHGLPDHFRVGAVVAGPVVQEVEGFGGGLESGVGFQDYEVVDRLV